jgi:phospholipid:diacylglycerol acyltransferase
MDFESFNFDLQSIVQEFPSLGLNVTEFVQPGRDWLNSKATNFVVGRQAAERGLDKHHSVISKPRNSSYCEICH